MNRMLTRNVEPLHVADLRIHAWAATREACVAEAVHALVASFVGGVPPHASAARFDVLGDTDTDLLTGVLRTVIFRLRTWNEVPIATDVEPIPAGLRLCCTTVEAAAIVPIGVLPKGVSTIGVRCQPWPGGWWCGASIDL
jgi:SHS2 domain-containing protein